MLSGLYASEITFQNEWNFLSSSFAQIGFEVIGNSSRYRAGWPLQSANAKSIPARADGYRGPPVTIDTSTVVQTTPSGCRKPEFCNDAELLNAFGASYTAYKDNTRAAANTTGCTASPLCSGSTLDDIGCSHTDRPTVCLPGLTIQKEDRTFTIGAVGDIGGDNSDQWTINYNKELENIKSGL